MARVQLDGMAIGALIECTAAVTRRTRASHLL
jgi:hypothetical protein